MKPEEIDKIISSRLNSLDTPPPQVSWNKLKSWEAIEKQMTQARKEKVLWPYYAVAASLFVMIGFAWYVLSFVEKKNDEISRLKQELKQVQAEKLVESTKSIQETPTKLPSVQENLQVKGKISLTKPLRKKQIQLKQEKNSIEKSILSVDTTLIVYTSNSLLPERKDSVYVQTEEMGNSGYTLIQEKMLEAREKLASERMPRQVTVIFPADKKGGIYVIEHRLENKADHLFSQIIINGKSKYVQPDQVSTQNPFSQILISNNKE